MRRMAASSSRSKRATFRSGSLVSLARSSPTASLPRHTESERPMITDPSLAPSRKSNAPSTYCVHLRCADSETFDQDFPIKLHPPLVNVLTDLRVRRPAAIIGSLHSSAFESPMMYNGKP